MNSPDSFSAARQHPQPRSPLPATQAVPTGQLVRCDTGLLAHDDTGLLACGDTGQLARDDTDADVYESVAYLYDGTLEGLLTCVFRAYENHEDPEDIAPSSAYQPRIGQYVSEIATDLTLSNRVASGICRVAGTDAYNLVKAVGLSCTPTCGTLTLAFVRYAMRKGHKWDADVLHPAVEPMLRIRRSMATEKEHVLQFMRFEELEGDLWFAKCNPKANLLPFVMDFFSARFNTQRFIIYDEVHHLAGIHEGRNASAQQQPGQYLSATSDGPKLSRLAREECDAQPRRAGTPTMGRNSWYLVPTEGTGFPDNLPTRSDREQTMRRAWKTFYDSVSIEARYNPELRVHWMPKRFWRNITEMQDT